MHGRHATYLYIPALSGNTCRGIWMTACIQVSSEWLYVCIRVCVCVWLCPSVGLCVRMHVGRHTYVCMYAQYASMPACMLLCASTCVSIYQGIHLLMNFPHWSHQQSTNLVWFSVLISSLFVDNTVAHHPLQTEMVVFVGYFASYFWRVFTTINHKLSLQLFLWCHHIFIIPHETPSPLSLHHLKSVMKHDFWSSILIFQILPDTSRHFHQPSNDNHELSLPITSHHHWSIL